MTSRPVFRLLALLTITTLAACSSESGSESPAVGEWESETTTVDNVTTVPRRTFPGFASVPSSPDFSTGGVASGHAGV